MNYWLIKSEPATYSIERLRQEGETIWDGVRNYQARNFLRRMKKNDLAFFYHSNTNPAGIVGMVTVVEGEIVDPSQFDTASPYYDARSNPDRPTWITVKVAFKSLFTEILSLKSLKEEFTADELLLVRKGNRLSVMPVAVSIAHRIEKMIDNLENKL